jgi:peptidoglycan/LPS O-acetylase OafA/YrhL
MNYIKPLDSLRAIAVFLVIIWHWLEGSWINTLPNGPIGVIIFFVLSGFLITRILLEGRNKSEQFGASKMVFFKNFYIRRSLRIFPIYYMLVGAIFIYTFLQHEGVSKFLYFFTYTSNYYFMKVQHWDKELSHLWTLAVEEQFYLIWPLVILTIPKRYLLPCIILFIAIGIATQCIVGDAGFGMYATYTCFDSLGMGALLAWVTVYKPEYQKKFCTITGIIAIPLLLLVAFEILYLQYYIFPFRIKASFIGLFIVSYIVYTSYYRIKLPFIINQILNNSILASIGKISYGLYIYHILVSHLYKFKFLSFFYGNLPSFLKNQMRYTFTINFLILLIVSYLSWQLIEKPILRLKGYLEIKEKKKVTALAV